MFSFPNTSPYFVKAPAHVTTREGGDVEMPLQMDKELGRIKISKQNRLVRLVAVIGVDIGRKNV